MIFGVCLGSGLRLVEVVGVVFEYDDRHGLLPLLEDYRSVVGDFTLRERLAVDACRHEPPAVVVTKVDVLDLASVIECHESCRNDLLSSHKGDGLSVGVDGEGLEPCFPQLLCDLLYLVLWYGHRPRSCGFRYPQLSGFGW